jgi:putative intracellular protease/amidase/quinol monooxygenase YgiN
MSSRKVLIAVTSHDRLGTTGAPTGYYLSEVSHPYFELADRGFAVDFISPKGGLAPMDPGSRRVKDAANDRFLQDAALLARLEATLRPDAIDARDYRAILFAGGHGTMWDFPNDAGLIAVARAIYEAGGVVAAVCHGPAALVNLTLSDGTHLLRNRRIAAFTGEEERAAGLEDVVPFPLAATLVERGAIHEQADLWQPKVVVDGRIVTGQNPASAAGVGRAVADTLEALDNRPPVMAAPLGARPVCVIVRLRAIDGMALKHHLLTAIPVTRTASGCRYSHTYQDPARPDEFLLVQGWDSLEQQRGYLAWRERHGDVAELQGLLRANPVIESFGLLDA